MFIKSPYTTLSHKDSSYLQIYAKANEALSFT